MASKPSSASGGVPVFSIGGRMVNERERLLGMTEEERRWRAQFLKDQILDPGEPRFSPEYYRATTNIFRRMVRYPMQMLEVALTPVMGQNYASHARYMIGRGFVLFMAGCLCTYYFKYNSQDWTRCSGWYMFSQKRRLLPGDPDYPNVYEPKPSEYYDGGFSKSVLYKQ